MSPKVFQETKSPFTSDTSLTCVCGGMIVMLNAAQGIPEEYYCEKCGIYFKKAVIKERGGRVWNSPKNPKR